MAVTRFTARIKRKNNQSNVNYRVGRKKYRQVVLRRSEPTNSETRLNLLDCTSFVLDVGKFQVVAFNGLKYFSFKPEETEKLLKFKPKKVFLERTGMYHRPITKVLLEHGVEVYEILTRKFKKFREQYSEDVKTDKRDVEVMWKFVQVHNSPRITYVTDELEKLLRKRQAVVNSRRFWKCFLESCKINREEENTVYCEELIKSLDKECIGVDKRLKDFVDPVIGDKYGVVLSATFLSFRPERFSSSMKWVAYLGFRLKTAESGTLSKKRKLSKKGPAEARRLLYLRVMTAIQRKQQPFYEYFLRAKERGKPGLVPMVNTMRKIARHFWAEQRSMELHPTKTLVRSHNPWYVHPTKEDASFVESQS